MQLFRRPTYTRSVTGWEPGLPERQVPTNLGQGPVPGLEGLVSSPSLQMPATLP